MTKDDVLKQAVVFSNEDITTAWGNSDLSHLQLVSTNKQYRALPQSTWDSILATHLTAHVYVTDFFDCDAFAAAFLGLVVWNYEVNGVVRVFDNGGHHSYNAVLICDDGKTCSWQKVEPQADIFVDHPPQNVKITVPAGTYSASSGFAVTA